MMVLLNFTVCCKCVPVQIYFILLVNKKTEQHWTCKMLYVTVVNLINTQL